MEGTRYHNASVSLSGGLVGKDRDVVIYRVGEPELLVGAEQGIRKDLPRLRVLLSGEFQGI